jgi:hypothetical protein
MSGVISNHTQNPFSQSWRWYTRQISSEKMGWEEDRLSCAASGKDSHQNLKTVIRIERTIMNKERLDWVMSGLNQHALTNAEDQFLKAALQDFDKNNALTERQEERLENLYKLKSQSTPNKKSDHYSFKKSAPKKTEPRRPRTKIF